MKKLILLIPFLVTGCVAPQPGYYAQPQAPIALEGSNPYYDNFTQRRMERQDRIAEQNYRQQHIQELQQQNRYVPAFENPNWYDNR